MSELLLISHNTLPKKQFIARTEENVKVSSDDDQVAGFFFFNSLKTADGFHCLPPCLLKSSFEIITASLCHKLPPLSGTCHLMPQAWFVSAHFHSTELRTAFWTDLLYRNQVLRQLESQNSFSQANNPVLSQFHSLPCVILAYFF